jgi:hypothetical protein
MMSLSDEMIVQPWVVWYSSRASLAMVMSAPGEIYRHLQAHRREAHHFYRSAFGTQRAVGMAYAF